MGDVIHGKLASFSLSGKLDRTPPKLNFAAAGVAVVSPLVPVGLTLSEAMKSAELTLEGTSALPLTTSDESVHSSFSSPTVLPFTGAWQVGCASEALRSSHARRNSYLWGE